MSACANFVTVNEALDLVLEGATPLSADRRPLADALGLRLAEDIRIDSDFPPFDRARMDGFAVRAADVPHAPVELRVIEEIAAGQVPQMFVGAGEASRINTGAPMPEGADTVVPIEQTIVDDETKTVTILEAPRPNQHNEKRGLIQTKGRRVLSAGTRLGPMQLSIAATAGARDVSVHRRPTVRVVVTGNELVAPDKKLEGAQIRESNGIALASLAAEAGCDVQPPVHASDEKSSLATAITAAMSADVLIVSGGVSMGQLDLVPAVLEELGAKPVFQKVRVKPGRPLLFSRGPNDTYIFALPGNPVSCFVCFWLFVRPLLARLQGQATCRLDTVTARCTGSLAATGDRESFWPAVARSRIGGSIWADPLPWHGSGDPFPFAKANALIRQEALGRDIRKGETMTILPLELLPTSLSPGDSGSGIR